jgi:hypothetical protein
MKKRILYFIGGLVLLAFACTPIEKRETAGPLLSPEDIQLNVYSTTDTGNQIVMINNTPNVGGTWDYVIAKSTRQQDTILLPFLGTTTIKFYATTPGGVVMVKKDVVVTGIDHPLDVMWSNLAGTGTKNWVWNIEYDSVINPDGSKPAGPWGNGSYKNHWAPGWWSGIEDMTKDHVLNDVMTFDLNGAANFTLVTGNTAHDGATPKGPQAGTYHGSFIFDMTQTMNADNGLPWLLGTLTLTTPVSYGFYPNEKPGYTWVYKYYFTTINANEMVLCAPDPGASSSWDECWFWMFIKQGYHYPKK